ncbi:MAG: M1 family metallopeptidase [Pseudomonadota bacterium]
MTRHDRLSSTLRMLTVSVFAIGLTACGPSSPKHDDAAVSDTQDVPAAREYAFDVHSFAKPNEAHVTHAELDLTVEFEARQLVGTARLTVERKPGVSTLWLDTRDLDVRRATLIEERASSLLKFRLGEIDPNLGRALIVDLPDNDQTTLTVEIKYASQPAASGLQWLTPEQTAGKQNPFLFTQSQAIHARSWIPIQDTPGVRMTYGATIRVPSNLRAVMSASNEPTSEKRADGVYRFEMPQAIPAYLIALGVGDLVFEPMSGRTGVFAEPTIVESAAAEFADTEQMLVISEELFGPYRWGRYDLLILPPSFPFGGMENPRLSFITPTVIAGDKSLVSLIAHELAHSWSGNLVTNGTWRDLWLNEGFTSFLTTRIMEAVYGKDRADMEYFLDYQSLVDELKGLPAPDQLLAIDLTGRDPDDVFSGVPYTKGQMFVNWLETRFGREKFDVFLRKYFDAFAFQSISTDQFIDYLMTNLVDKHPGTVTRSEVDEWIFEDGLPDASMVPVSDAFTAIDAQGLSWLNGSVALGDLDTSNWSVHEWLYFLNKLPSDLSGTQLEQLDSEFALTESRNNEIVHSWMRHVIRHDYQPGFARLEQYLLGIGRRKLIVPLYDDLMATPAHREFAFDVYKRARPGYHPLAQGTVEAILNRGE